jgi:hypothetical protein
VIVEFSLLEYLKDSSWTRDWNIRRQTLRYTLLTDELYRRIIDGLFLEKLEYEYSSADLVMETF